MDSIPKKMPTESTLRNRPDEAVFIKPCETMLSNKPSDMMLIKPCGTTSESSTKKRRIMSHEEEEEEMKGEHEEEFSTFAIEEGKHVDVKALLSSKSRDFLVTTKGGEEVPIADLDGKYVLVCCFLVPFDTDCPETRICRALEALYSELSLQGNADQLKVVIVGKVNSSFTMDNFAGFFSRLSFDCLAIPFFDTKSRERVFESLYTYNNPGYVACLAVHPSGEVLKLDRGDLDMYGSQSFPFSEEHIANIDRQDESIRERLCSINSTISLQELLHCHYLSRIADENNSVPMAYLGDVRVALYLCYNGNFMVKLQDIHKRCLHEGHKLEIVLVTIPFESPYDPAAFYNLMKQSALKNPTSSSWFAFPFSDKICRSLWRLLHCDEADQLIILPHGSRPGDLWGKHIATSYGIDAYPFTRDIIIDRKVNEIRKIALEQFLGDNHFLDLRNKNVLLYLDSPSFKYGRGKYRYYILHQEYCEFKIKYPDSEVFFVPLVPIFESEDGREFRDWAGEWPILPPQMCESVMEHFYGNGCVYPTLLTFGKDGKILSRFAQLNSSESLFDDTLASEILSDLEKEIW